MTQEAEPPQDGAAPSGISFRGLLGHTSIYAIAPLFQRFLAIGLVHLYTKKLSRSEWGILSLTDLMLGLLPIIVGTSLVAGLSRHYFVHDDQRDRSSVVSGVMLATVAASCAISAFVLIFRGQVAERLFTSAKAAAGGAAEYETFVVLCALIFPLALISTVGIEALQVEKRSKAVVKITIAKTLLESALKLVFLFALGMGVKGFLYAVLVGEALTALGLLAFVAKRHGLQMHWRTFWPLLRYSLPLIPVGVFQLGLHQADKLLIERLGPEDIVKVQDGIPLTRAMEWLGTYSFGYQIPFLLHVAAVGSFMRIWLPNVFAVRDDASRAPEVMRIGTVVLTAIALGQTIVAIFAREGVTLLAGDDAYLAATPVVPWIAAGYIAYASFTLGQAALMSVFATRTLAAVNGIALAINLGLNYALIPEFGIIGAAAATVVSFTCLGVMTSLAAGKRQMLPFGTSVLPVAGVVVFTATWLAAQVDAAFSAWSPAALALKATLSAAACFSLYWVVPSSLRFAALQSLKGRLSGAVGDRRAAP